MLLPNAERAEIDPEKLRGYLLSPTHPVGRLKMRFFAALGCSADDWQTLEADLRIQHLCEDAEPGAVTPLGSTRTLTPPGKEQYLLFVIKSFTIVL